MTMFLTWLLGVLAALLGGINIFQVVYYKTQRDILRAQADSATVDAKHKGLDLMQDQYDYVFNYLSKLQVEYLDLQEKVRKDASEYTAVIQEKCNEIAEQKSKVVYYKGLRCYKSDCSTRISQNPKDKEVQS